MPPKNPFKRGRGSSGPQDPGDQWFRPETPPAGKGKASTQPPKPSAADAPTESFVPPKNWLDQNKGAGSGPGRGKGAAAAGPPKKLKKKKSRKRRYFQRSLWALLAIGTIGFVMILVAYSRINIPDANEVSQQQTTRVYYTGNDREIGRFGEINRTIVGLDKMPQSLRDAVLAAENRSFYSDNGVSPKGMTRALWVNLRGGSTQGGSTITQQYVKNTYLSSERSIQRKLKEAMLSIKIDREKSKDQILEDYLNTIYLGRGAYGMQAAAKAYFNKDVQNLSVSEGAALAAIIQRPSRFEPTEAAGKAALQARWTYVVDAMVGTKAITPEQRASLKFPKFPKQAKSQSRFGGQTGYILTAVKKELRERGMTTDDIENGGYRIVTTLDPEAEQAALDAVAKEFPKTLNKGLRTGLVAVEPAGKDSKDPGAVRAMYGGPDFLGKGKYAQVNTATYPIQSGSTMKVFTTAALLEAGYTLNSTFTGNSPLRLPGSKPVNNEFNQSYGSVTLRKALQDSINTAFVQATFKLGSSKVRDAIQRAGIPKNTPGLETNARITLGIASTPAIEIAGAYATLCGGGIAAEPHLVDRVIQPNGGDFPIDKPKVSPEPVFEPDAIAGTLEAMQDVVKFGTGTKAKALGRPVAGKTGTHQNLTAWFSGCTPQLAASVLYFKGDGTKSLDGTAGMSTFFGGTYPAQTWTTFMKGALRGQPVEKFPDFKGVDSSAKPTPSEDPFNVGGFDEPEAPPVVPTTGPVFPAFTPAPTSVPSPAPKPTTAPPTAGPTTSAGPPDTPSPTASAESTSAADGAGGG